MRPLNFTYFALFFFAIAAMSLLSLLRLPTSFSPWMALYAIGQALLEVTVFAWLIHSATKPFLKNIYCTLFFTLLMIHFTNFEMARLLDTSILYLLKFFVGHGASHIIQVFQAINMNEFMIGFILFTALLIPSLAIFLYRILQSIHLYVSSRAIAIFAMGLFLLLGLCEKKAIATLSYEAHQKYSLCLPFLTTFQKPFLPAYPLKSGIGKVGKPSCIDRTSLTKPNIYLFVIETFRKDFITPSIAPSLSSFGKENIALDKSCANANATQHSWFAIFHSLFPYHWTHSLLGSEQLKELQKLGYKIHVYSSADLRYFEMDLSILGPQRSLATTLEEYALDRSLSPWQRDAKLFDAFDQTLETPKSKEGNMFIFFLDATHSEYSFPNHFAARFTPIANKINYLFLNLQELEPMINRYRNAISYVDSLMNRFFTKLKTENLYDDAVIAITGDHGEEFYEEGALFHGTHLNRYQTEVPIFLKCKNPPKVHAATFTHIDILPSIFHFLTGKEIDGVDGRSIFSEKRHPFLLATLQNGAQTPEEFTLENESYRIRARFSNPHNLYEPQNLYIVSCEKNGIAAEVPLEAFDMLIDRSVPAAP